jgi:hypothetical protein
MKKQTQQRKQFKLHTYIWSLFVFSILAYCGTIGMITFDVVERKSLNQEAQKIAALVAKQEEVLSEKTRTLSVGSGPMLQSQVVAYIDVQEVEAIGFAQ